MSSEKIGEYLKRERELRGISLDELSSCTKISKRLLLSIEGSAWDEFPSEVFIRGFLRNYADCIGISPDDVLLRYEEETKETSDETSHNKATDKRLLFAILALIIITITIFLVNFH